MDELMEKWHDQFGTEEEEKSALVSCKTVIWVISEVQYATSVVNKALYWHTYCT